VQRETGWKPKLTAIDGVALTATWYKKVLGEKLNAHQITRMQIQEHLNNG
jgi:hypothetical protein